MPFFENEKFQIKDKQYGYDGSVFHGKLNKAEIVRKAFLFLNTPYLWGGTTPFGIDCSGFVQQVFRAVANIDLPRDAYQQAEIGDDVYFSDLQSGDLAFFNNAKVFCSDDSP